MGCSMPLTCRRLTVQKLESEKKQAHFWVCQPLLLATLHLRVWLLLPVDRLCRGVRAALESKDDCSSAILTLVTKRLLFFS